MHVRKATLDDVEGICRVYTDGWRATYPGLISEKSIEEVIADFYNPERVRAEVLNPEGWNGWWVALDENEVVGAGGGGMTGETSSELFVLYADPNRRGQGIGTLLLDAISTEIRAQGATVQKVAVTKDNEKGLPFYQARGFSVVGEREAHGIADERGSVVLERTL